MEYIAIRENLRRQQYIDSLRATGPMGEKMVNLLTRQHPGQSFGAAIPGEITPAFVRDEVAARAIIPANINHPESEPMIIGRNFPGEDQRQYRQQRGHFQHSGRSGKNDLGYPLGPIPSWICRPAKHPRNPRMDHAQQPGADWHGADLSGAGKVDGKAEELTWEIFRDTLIEQAEQGVDYFTIHAGVLLRYVPMTANRMTGIVSRGGSIMAKWCLAHHKENFLHPFRGNLRNHEGLRRQLLARRRPASGFRAGMPTTTRNWVN